MIEITRGDDRTLEFTVLAEDGSPLDLTTFDVFFTARLHYWSPDWINKSLDDGITIQTGENNNVVNVQLDAVDTSWLKPCTLNFKLKCVDVNSDNSTVSKGRLRINA